MQFLKETVVVAAVVSLLTLYVVQLHSPQGMSLSQRPVSTETSSAPAEEAEVAAAFERHPPAWVLLQPGHNPVQGRTTMVAQARTIMEPRPATASADAPPLPTRAPHESTTSRDEIRWVHVAGRQVNVRKAPTLTAGRLTSYPQGKRLELVGRLGNWARVRDPETGTDGWMAARYVTGVGGVRGGAAPGT